MDMRTRDGPPTAADLEAILQSVRELACQSRHAEALTLCDWLIDAAPAAAAAYRQRAAVRDRLRDRLGAIDDMQAVTTLCGCEAADFHILGTLLLRGAATVPAIAAFDRSIALCEQSGNRYYLHASLLCRASARLKLAHIAASMRDALRLPPRYGSWVPGEGMRAKEELLSAAHAALERRRKGRPWGK